MDDDDSRRQGRHVRPPDFGAEDLVVQGTGYGAPRVPRERAFPVLDDDGKVTGVSEADTLAKEVLDGRHDGMRGMMTSIVHRKKLRKAGGVTVGDLMTSPAVTVAPDDTVEHAAWLMCTRGLKRLPVVDTAGAHSCGEGLVLSTTTSRSADKASSIRRICRRCGCRAWRK